MGQLYRRALNAFRVRNPLELLWSYRYNSNADASVDNTGRIWVRIDTDTPVPIYSGNYFSFRTTSLSASALAASSQAANVLRSLTCFASTPGAYVMVFPKAGAVVPVLGEAPMYTFPAPMTGFVLPSLWPLSLGLGATANNTYFMFSSTMDTLTPGPVGWIAGTMGVASY